MRSDIFDSIPDWVEFAILLLILPWIARAAVKERTRLTAIQADERQSEDDRAKASKRLTHQKIAAPFFGVTMLLLVGSYIYRFIY